MRFVLALATLASVAGCASNEYSKVPEPTGEWVPANPPGLMTENAPSPPSAAKTPWRRGQPVRLNAVAAR